MSVTRRNFLEEIMAAGFLSGAVSTSGFSRTTIESLLNSEPEMQGAKRSGPANSPDGQHDAHEFWDSFFDSVGPQTKGGPKPSLEAQDRKVQYIHYGQNGLRYVNDVKPDELLDYDGDVMVSASLGQFRPGADDHTLLQSVKSSQLRVDFVQTKSFMNVLAPMAWAALAVFAHDKPGKLPSLEQLGYKAPNYVNGIQRVLLPGGTGKFAVNVSTLKPESALHKILKIVVPMAMAVAPVLNLPAISIPVLKTFTELYLGPDSERRTTFLLNSLPAQWTATQQARSDPDLEVENLPLVSGNYVMVPQAHAEELGKDLSKLDWQSGYLVPKDASQSESLATRAQQVIPGVTYVSMRLTVTKVQPGAAGPAKSGGNEEESGGGSNKTTSKPSKPGPAKSPTPFPSKKP
jgi:hypothetical protein